MRLLDEKAFPDPRAIVKEQCTCMTAPKREAVDHEGNRLLQQLTKAYVMETCHKCKKNCMIW